VDAGRPPLEIDADGTLRSVELKIVNLQPDDKGGLEWKKVFPLFFTNPEFEAKELI
jgi:hypothetical protein